MFFDKKTIEELNAELNSQMTKLQGQFDTLFFIDANGNERARPNTTSLQVKAFKAALLKLQAIYKERIEAMNILNKEQAALNQSIAKTKGMMLDFQKDFPELTLPEDLRSMYNIK